MSTHEHTRPVAAKLAEMAGVKMTRQYRDSANAADWHAVFARGEHVVSVYVTASREEVIIEIAPHDASSHRDYFKYPVPFNFEDNDLRMAAQRLKLEYNRMPRS